MELYKRGDYWAVDYRDADGARVRKSTGRKDKKGAQEVAQQLQKDVWARQAARSDGRRVITLGEALSLYVVSLAGKASYENCRATRLKMLGEHPAMAGRWGLKGDMMFHEVTPTHLTELIAARRAEGNGAQTIAHELKLLRATSLMLGADRGVAVPEITKWKLPELPQKTRYLTPAEYRALIVELETIPVHLKGHIGEGARLAARDIAVVLAATGIRYGELCGLRWDQVDAPNFGMIRVWGRKTQTERLAGVSGGVQEVLQRLWDRPGRDATVVFPKPSGGLRFGSCRPILTAMDRLGFNTPVSVERHGRATVHSLRHTFASWQLQAGAGIAEVSASLGHASIVMTQRYAHLEAHTNAAQMANRMDAIMKKEAVG